MTAKRYVCILDYSEKEVRIFDEHNQKNIFNIFFEGLDSAICLKGALEDTVDLLNELHKENRRLQRHIKRSTFNKIRVEDVFNCAKYDKFYDNEEAIKSIDWIAKALGVDFE